MVNEEYNEWVKAMKALNNLITHYYRILMSETKPDDLIPADECYKLLKNYLLTHTERDKNDANG